MPNAASLRSALASFLGEERYRKFVAQGVAPRMRWWQEQLWEQFCVTHPQFAVGLEALQGALRVCEVHGMELLPTTAELFVGCIDYGRDPDRARLYPHAADRPVSTEGGPVDAVSTSVWYCPACRLAADRAHRA